VFADNDASANDSGSGGAVYAINTGSTSGPLTTFTNCMFIRNHAYGEGGAIKFTGDMNTLFTRCEFIENTCNYGGGAISFYSVLDTKMVHCLFARNSTLYSNGGAIHSLGFGNTFTFENCTLTENSAENGDGGGVNLVFATATFINSIIYNNPGAYSDDIYLDMDGHAEINYSDLNMPDGATGSNNINEDPLFSDADILDFHLSENSPCIDAGVNIGYPYNGEAPDMGCFEFETTTGINDYYLTELSVFPNPTSGKVYLKLTDSSIKIWTVSDLKGRVIIKELSNNSIDLSSLENGVYLVAVETDKGLLTTKVVKE
jgi:predicted outer membrane repeat protein